MTRAQQVGVIVGLVIVAALTILRASDPQLLRLAREVAFDEYQRIAPRAFEDLPVRVVDIDEASLQRTRPVAVAAHRIAELVDRLSADGCVSDRVRHSVRRAGPAFAADGHARCRRDTIRRCRASCRTMTTFSRDRLTESRSSSVLRLSNEGNYPPPDEGRLCLYG